MSDSVFVKCQCGGCSVLEFNFDEDLECINVSIWENRETVKLFSKQERVRWCEHVMKTGNPWADHTIISKKDAKKIVNFLTKYIKHGKTKARNKRSRT